MKIENADISWLESGLPYSTQFEDIYYSREDELAESRHVFLEANSLGQRWQQESERGVFHIGELGFGSGLNFLQTVKLWCDTPSRPDRLHYIAFEKHPLLLEDMRRIHSRWPSLAGRSEELLEQYNDHAEGCHRLRMGNGITLDLYYGDAQQQLDERMRDACPAIQCWFLDGFSPASNHELWDQELMHSLASCSEQATTLSTYSVAGKVRKALSNAGFEVKKIEGFGRKRHSLFASMGELQNDKVGEREAPWFTLPKRRYGRQSAVVVGAGLAGCSSAYSLAQRGWKVTVVDASPGPASAASGNSQLALRCRLFNSPSVEAQFFLHGYLFALRQWKQLCLQGENIWSPCGVLQLADAMNKRSPLKPDRLEQNYSPQVVQALSKEDASLEAGVALTSGGLFFSSAGAMDPTELCRAYLAAANIECVFDTRVNSLRRAGESWELALDEAPPLSADVVILANSHAAQTLEQCSGLPLQSLRGQTTEIASNASSEALKCVVSGSRTVFPAKLGRHLISASYSSSTDLQALSSDNQINIANATDSFADVGLLESEPVLDRVSLRCNSPDRLPLIGMAPDLEKMAITYAPLAKNAKAKIHATGDYHEGLYLNIAHGSNGLASCPLGAEYLASLITGENLPLSRNMAASLNPTRFLIQRLKKQK
ncbi:MAG: tRNA 5-methylaminomethyl-2-thiouridine biosynthesis bifunctional protein MnmC [Pseudohongiella sp.]|nr:MAG: tRNA 5-methylaminomethyl-2-thiouridine biosynthesis bifunctional protein MnmC [Pseudohongiella sp.]